MTATRGRKHVLLFSAGFDDEVLTGQTLAELANDSAMLQAGQAYNINTESRFGSADLRRSLEQAMKNLQASDTVFHAFDVRGLGHDAGRCCPEVNFSPVKQAKINGRWYNMTESEVAPLVSDAVS